MIGIVLQAVSTFFEEIGGSLGKWMVERKEESYYALGFQNAILVQVFFVALVAFDPSRWKFDPRSIPTLIVFMLAAILQGWATMKSTSIAERSTFNFIRTGTIPLLLAADLLLGYVISNRQAAGILLILIALVVLFVNHGVDKKGTGLTAFTAVNSVVTISIYKWHITAFNSVATEQILVHCALVPFYFWGARHFFRENAFGLFRKPHAILQSAAYGVGSAIESFAYLYAPASVIVTAKRSFAVLWSVVSGNRVFHEKALGLRIAVLAFVVIGLILLVR
jgi:hypothetical protein